MSIINKPTQAPLIEGDPYEVAKRIMDLLFPYFHEYESINLTRAIIESNLSDSDKILARHLEDKIEILMYSKLNYAERKNPSNFHGCLTPLGREVKSAGGHFSYLNNLKKQREADFIRQSLIDKKLLQDLINAEFEGKQGRKIKKWTLFIAFVTLILSLGGSTVINKLLLLDKNQVIKNEVSAEIINSAKIKRDSIY